MIKELALIRRNNGNPALRIVTDKETSFMPLTTAFEIHHANEFLRSLKPDYFVHFKSWNQYEELIGLISEGLSAA